jgi:hypothetical protein
MKALIGLMTLLWCCGLDMRSMSEDGSKPEHPFRVRFTAYEGGPGSRPGEMSFAIQLLDPIRQGTFYKVGDKVFDTNLRLLKFEFKEEPNAKTGEKDDVSEVTLVDISTGKQLIIAIGKAKDISEAK